MRQKLLLLLTALCFGFVSGVKADVDVPMAVYFNDFSSTEGLTVVGNGAFEDDADARFGKIFHNNPQNSDDVRTNYLTLPSSVFSAFSSTGGKTAMSIGFWVNVKNTTDYTFCPLFAAYNAAPNPGNTFPMMVLEARGLVQWNCNGYFDTGIWSNSAGPYNDGTPYNSVEWLEDGNWHYYTLVLTSTTAKVYIDGDLKNGWTVDGTSDGQKISGLFSDAATNLTYICLGGNQAWNWSDKDSAFGFDDFAVYDAALSAEQIAQVISDKLHYTVNAVDGNSIVFKVLADANSISNSVSVAYPRYILDGTTLREAAATSSNYTKTYTLTSSSQTENIAYTNSTVSNVYYYAEGEDVLTNNRTLTNQSFSMNKIGFTTNSSTYVKVTTLPAGTWTITARYYCANKTGAHNGYIKVGDAVMWSQEYANGAGGNSEKTSESFTITQPTAMYVAADGGNGTGFDWFYVSGTPSNTIVGQPDCSIDYLQAMTEKVALTPGQSYHYKFVNHNMGSTAGWAQNWILPVYASDGATKRIVIRSDNWEDIAWKNDGLSWTTSSGIWYDDFLAEMNGAIVDMTVNYSAEKVFTMSCNITTSTGRTLTYSYNSTNGGITLTDESIKVALSISMSWLELLYEGSTGNVSKTITAAGWATYCSPYALDLANATGLTDAYIVTGGADGVLMKTSVKNGTVPANTGLLLKGDAGTASIPVVATSNTDVNGNILEGVTEATVIPAETGWVLMGSPSLGFYQNANAFTVGANTAYIPVSDLPVPSSGARAAFWLDDDATGINAIEAAEAENSVKDGKFLENGKIVIVKNGVKYGANGQKLN